MPEFNISKTGAVLSIIIALTTIFGGFVKMSVSFATVENTVKEHTEQIKETECRLSDIEKAQIQQLADMKHIMQSQEESKSDTKEMLKLLKGLK